MRIDEIATAPGCPPSGRRPVATVAYWVVALLALGAAIGLLEAFGNRVKVLLGGRQAGSEYRLRAPMLLYFDRDDFERAVARLDTKTSESREEFERARPRRSVLDPPDVVKVLEANADGALVRVVRSGKNAGQVGWLLENQLYFFADPEPPVTRPQ